ncbi:hypothetical protein E3U43_005360 [Larimichthys crocea]|nr:hypothetical protein E3U43_005360 [Larimichthys crocea]
MGNQDGSQRRYDYVSQKLRELGRFLLAAKSLDPAIHTLQDLLAPGRLSLVLASARKASGYRWSRPPLAVKTALKTVCEIAIGDSLQDGDWEAAAKTTDFYHLLGREWDNLGLLDPDPETGTTQNQTCLRGTKLKKRSVQSRSENESKEPGQERTDPRPEVLSQGSTRLVSSVPPESRLQAPVTVPVAQRKVQRRPWSSAEKAAVWRQLGVHVLVQSVPGKEVCQRCLDLEPVLRGRHWKDIKNQVHNQIQSQKKQQFHAQMELQENQEQQDQVQNQKKQQQQYQAQMDQQGKDHNQKKHLYQAQMDHQDQGHIQNQKKQLYYSVLDQQDQDHLQIHKKQLYHMDEQTTLDRDSSVLTGPLYGPDGSHRVPGLSLLDRDHTVSIYPLPHRTLGPHMDQLLSRTEWTDESLAQHYSVNRNLVSVHTHVHTGVCPQSGGDTDLQGSRTSDKSKMFLSGYFVMKNCSVSHGKVKGVQCKPCTNCSAVDQDTLVKCSTFADSLCGNKTSPVVTSMLMPTELPVSAPEVWLLLPVIVLSLFLVLLLSLLLTLLSCRHRQQNKPKGLDLL